MERIHSRRRFTIAGPLCGGLVAFLLMTAAWADEASLTGEGGNVRPMAGHPTVRLVQADVQVRILEPTADERGRLSDSANLPAESADDDPWAAVTCTFVLKNTGPATTVKMGFPEQTWVGSGDAGKPLPGPYAGFASFESRVDGEAWETTTSEWRPADKPGFDQLRWRMKEVPFAANQTRTVRDAYVVELGYAGGGADWFRYTLSTGASWQGPIGRERVTLDLSGLRHWQLVSATPGSGLLPPAAQEVVWEWRDLSPQGDITEVRAEFLRGQYALVTRQMHSWLGVELGQMQHRNGVTMVPGDAVLGQYGRDQMIWDQRRHRLRPGGPPPWSAALTAGSKAVVLGERKVQLPVAPYVARTPSGYVNTEVGAVVAGQDVWGSSPSETLFVPLEATVKALGGRVYRIYSNGPLCVSFRPSASGTGATEIAPVQLSPEDLTGPRGKLRPGRISSEYEVVQTVWADLTGDGAPELILGIEPNLLRSGEGEWMRRSAGVVIYRGVKSGPWRRIWEFPAGWSAEVPSSTDDFSTWNMVGFVEARRVTGGKLPQVVFSLSYTGADFFGTDTFVFSYRNGTFVNLVPSLGRNLPPDSARGPGETALGTLGGSTAFLSHGPGRAESIAVWGWIWPVRAGEAKVDPHRYWGALFQWSPQSRRYRCVAVHQTKRKGKEGEREILRLLGVPAKLWPQQD